MFRKATQKQIKFLEELGIDVEHNDDLSIEEASIMIQDQLDELDSNYTHDGESYYDTF